MCVSCVMFVFISESHNLVHTCHDIQPSLIHCLLVIMHTARRVSILIAAMANMSANSE